TVPAIGHDGTVYLVSGDSSLYAVGPSGALAWKAPIGGKANTSPAVGAGGAIYVGGGTGPTALTALDKTGKQVWQVPTGSDVYSAPAIALDGTILIGSEDNQLYDVDRNGQQKWKFDVKEGTQNAIVAPNGWVYFTGKSTVCAVDGGGTLKWASQTKSDA